MIFVTSMSDPQVQETLRGVFRLVAPEIVLIGTACVVFLLGCMYNRRWLCNVSCSSNMSRACC